MKKVVRLNESQLKRVIFNAINEEVGRGLQSQKEELEDKYRLYLQNIENKYGKSVLELSQDLNFHILSWKEFAKKHASKDLYNYILF